jgi:hypothetical protein
VLVVEIINMASAHSLTVPVSPLAPGTVSVPAGVYLVRASLPSGELLTETAEVSAQAGAPPVTVLRRPAGRPTKGRGGTPVVVWVRLWRNGEPVSGPGGDLTRRDDGAVVIALSPGAGLNALQFGGRDVQWRVVCLPPGNSCRVSFERVPEEEDFEEGLRVRASGGDARVESVLDYEFAGQLDLATALAGDLVTEEAGRLPAYASADAAAVAGLLLVKAPRSAHLAAWVVAVGDQYGWLPDLHVVHAWRWLRERGRSKRAIARDLLLRAADAGVPRYTEGLRLLYDGLRLVAASDPWDSAAEEAVSEVRPYAEACDWASPRTTYWGRGPAEPSLARHLGEPDDWQDVTELRVGT